MNPMATRKPQSPPKDFEEALRELEQILAEIEKGEVGRYERASNGDAGRSKVSLRLPVNHR